MNDRLRSIQSTCRGECKLAKIKFPGDDVKITSHKREILAQTRASFQHLIQAFWLRSGIIRLSVFRRVFQFVPIRIEKLRSCFDSSIVHHEDAQGPTMEAVNLVIRDYPPPEHQRSGIFHRQSSSRNICIASPNKRANTCLFPIFSFYGSPLPASLCFYRGR